MKATVMESKNGRSVILTEDGMFRTVDGDYGIGWEFDYKVPLRSNKKLTTRIAAAAACLFMMLSMGTYSYQNLMVYATVTLHGTAPIQLELNRKDKVIGVKAIDKMGEALAEQLLDRGVRGDTLKDAVAKAEEILMAQKDKKEPSKDPKILCKSSDKLKELADMVRQGQQKAAAGVQTDAAKKDSKDTKDSKDAKDTAAGQDVTAEKAPEPSSQGQSSGSDSQAGSSGSSPSEPSSAPAVAAPAPSSDDAATTQESGGDSDCSGDQDMFSQGDVSESETSDQDKQPEEESDKAETDE